MKRYSRPTARPCPRRGFTLIELLMVIVIIAALIALLLPAISSVRTNMRVTEVRNELGGLDQALADFNLEFGKNPPSQIVLCEQASDWNGQARSRGIIRGLWPSFNFNHTTPRDYNGDGDTTDVITLKGDQCLVFFLGGFWDSTSGFRGFSPIPSNPFATFSQTAASPVGPFFEFDITRVVATTGGVPGADYTATNGRLERFPVYLDPLPEQTHPYVYASSYNGTAYNDADVQTPATGSTFTPYRLAAPPPLAAYHKPKTYQIISPGFDSSYGVGRFYTPDGSPVVDSVNDKDNITNFASGLLD